MASTQSSAPSAPSSKATFAFLAPVGLSVCVMLITAGVILGQDLGKVERPEPNAEGYLATDEELDGRRDDAASDVAAVYPDRADAKRSSVERLSRTPSRVPPPAERGAAPSDEDEFEDEYEDDYDEFLEDPDSVENPTPEQIERARKKLRKHSAKGPWPMGRMGAMMREKRMRREGMGIPEAQLIQADEAGLGGASSGSLHPAGGLQ